MSKLAAAALCASTLVACGGGGGSDGSATAEEEARLRRTSSTTSSTPTTTTTTSTPTSTTTTTTTPGVAPAMTTDTVWPPAFNPALYTQDGCSAPLQGKHATYNVGPNQQYTELTQVPWLSLVAGDVVNIYYRATPYATLIGLRAQGTADQPVTINGVTDASCNRPVLTAVNAVPAADSKAANFGADIQGSGIFKIHRAPSDDSSTHKASFIAIKNLKMVGAKSGNYYYTYNNSRVAYDLFTSAIYAVRVSGLLLENNEIMDNGNGVFINTRGISPIDFSSNVILRGNRIEGNGYMTDDHEHGTYIEARRVLYEGNYFGPARGGAALKDRSSGTVVRYNKIVAGARALDLVDSDEEYENNIFTDPLYNSAWVYGNVIVNDYASTEGFSIRLIHWGFDQDAARCRNGRLYFYGNTVVHRGYTSTNWYVSIFQQGTNGYDFMPPDSSNYQIDAWDNVFTNQGNANGTTQFAMLTELGQVNLKGTNYLPTGWIPVGTGSGTTVTTGSTVLTGSHTVLDSTTFTPAASTSILNRGNTFTPNYSAISSLAPTEFAPANLALIGEFEYNKRPLAKTKTLNSTIDLGAIERQ